MWNVLLDRRAVGDPRLTRQPLHSFYTWCAVSDIPELRLATTIDAWGRRSMCSCTPVSRRREPTRTKGCSRVVKTVKPSTAHQFSCCFVAQSRRVRFMPSGCDLDCLRVCHQILTCRGYESARKTNLVLRAAFSPQLTRVLIGSDLGRDKWRGKRDAFSARSISLVDIGGDVPPTSARSCSGSSVSQCSIADEYLVEKHNQIH